MDGAEFFKELKKQLAKLLDPVLKPGAGSYVRMAYWGFDLDLHLDSATSGKPLGQVLKEVADRGHRVDLVLWQPRWSDIQVGPYVGDTMAVDQDIANRKVKAAIDGYKGLIKVYCEVYKGKWMGTANHQKMTIVSRNGTLSALVGGFNLSSWYWDDAQHMFRTEFRGHGGGGTIHDTGVLVEGPATLDIENEWLRRWNKQFWFSDQTIPHGAPAGNGAVGTSPVKVLTTNSEGWSGGEVDIQAELERAIASASRYAYFENYAFADPGLVNKLCDMLQANANLRVIVCVPYPEADDPLSYLTRLALVKMSLASGTAFTSSGSTIQRSQCSTWALKKATPRSGKTGWLEDEYFEYKPTTGAAAMVQLRDITDIVAPRVTFYAPFRKSRSIYIHSKLAIFDDATVFVGTANFTYRSMRYDGEMVLRIDDAGFAGTVRNRVFTHWGIAAMTDVATQFSENHRRSTAPGAVKLEPLKLDDFQASAKPPAGGWADHTWY